MKRTKALKNAEREIEKAANDGMDKIIASTCLALHRHWGYGGIRLRTVINGLKSAFKTTRDEDGERSMLQILEDETGIELRLDDGTDWHGIMYLSHENTRPISDIEFVYARIRQKKWLMPGFKAAILVSMHRKYGWSAVRDQQLLTKMEEIIDEYPTTQALKDACYEETGIHFEKMTREGTVFIYPNFPQCKKCSKWSIEECKACDLTKELEDE